MKRILITFLSLFAFVVSAQVDTSEYQRNWIKYNWRNGMVIHSPIVLPDYTGSDTTVIIVLPTGEVDTVSLSSLRGGTTYYAGNNIEISNDTISSTGGGGEAQTLAIDTNYLTISGGNGVTLPLGGDVTTSQLGDSLESVIKYTDRSIDYKYSGVESPEGDLNVNGTIRTKPLNAKDTVITIIMDDINHDDYTWVYPLQQTYGINATHAIVSNKIINPTDSTMSIAQMNILKAFGDDFVGHTRTHANLTTLDSTQLYRELVESKYETDSAGFPVKGFVPPFGATDAVSLAMIRKYYQSSIRTISTGQNQVPLNSYGITRFSIDGSTLADIKAGIRAGIASGGWTVFALHPYNVEYNSTAGKAKVESVFAFLRDSVDVSVLNYTDAYNVFSNPIETGDRTTNNWTSIGSDGNIYGGNIMSVRVPADLYTKYGNLASAPSSAFPLSKWSSAQVNGANATGMPNNEAGILTTWGEVGLYAHQDYWTYNKNQKWMRYWDGSAWTTWQRLAFDEGLVHTTNTETIGGIKNFTSRTGWNTTNPQGIIHAIASPTGASGFSASYDDFIIEGNGSVGSTWIGATNGNVGFRWGDTASHNRFQLIVSNSTGIAHTYIDGNRALLYHPDGSINIGTSQTDPTALLNVEGVISWTGGSSTNANTAYNDKINSVVYDTTTNVLTLTQQDGGTLTTDIPIGGGGGSGFWSASGSGIYYANNVGINYTSPPAKLSIKTASTGGGLGVNFDEMLLENLGNTGITIRSSNTGNGGIAFADVEDSIAATFVYEHNNDKLHIAIGGTRRMEWWPDGSVGIGTNQVQPDEMLEVNGNIKADTLFGYVPNAAGFISHSFITSNFTLTASDSSTSVTNNTANAYTLTLASSLGWRIGATMTVMNDSSGVMYVEDGTATLRKAGTTRTVDTILTAATIKYLGNETFVIYNGASQTSGGTGSNDPDSLGGYAANEYALITYVDSADLVSDTINLTVSRDLVSTDAGKLLRFAGTDTIWIDAEDDIMNSGQSIEFITYNFKTNGRIGLYSSDATLKDANGNVLDSVLLPPVVKLRYEASGKYIVVAETGSASGWARYQDDTYTTGSPFSVVDGTTVTLPNNAQTTILSQMPYDLDSMFSISDTTILGKSGDAYAITVEFKVRPNGVGANPRMIISFDIGGAIGEIFTREQTLVKGNGVEHYHVSTTAVYTLDTWESNGAKVKVSAVNEDLEIYDIRFMIFRTHKAN